MHSICQNLRLDKLVSIKDLVDRGKINVYNEKTRVHLPLIELDKFNKNTT